MPALPVFQQYYFFKNDPKNLTKVENFKKKLHSWYSFYRGSLWYIAFFDTLSISCEIDRKLTDVKYILHTTVNL